MPAGQLQPNASRDDGAEHRGDRALRDGAGNGDPSNGEQFLDVKLQADAEHQQDDADLGELLGDLRVGDESRRVRTDQRAREQIADDRRQARALREVAENQRGREAAGERQDQIEVVHRRIVLRQIDLALERAGSATSCGGRLRPPCARSSRITRLYHHEVSSGVRIAVTMTDAATCTVAASATGTYVLSAIATACGHGR